jgi:branched-subunit amino acid transport protein
MEGRVKAGVNDQMRWETLLLIFGMAIVTFIPRFVPMAFLSRWGIPEKVKVGLEYIPVAILSAIVFPILFFDEKETIGVQPHLILSAIPVFIFAWKTKSLWGSILLGMLIYWSLGFVL